MAEEEEVDMESVMCAPGITKTTKSWTPKILLTGCGCSVNSMSAWYASILEINPHIHHILCEDFFPSLLIQEEQVVCY